MINYREQMDKIAVHLGKITKLYHECAKSQGISYNTMMVLAALRHFQSCTQKQIVEEWGMPKQSVNTIIKKLFDDKYVEFSQGCNNKEKLVTFTHKGTAYADKVLKPILDMEVRVLQHIGEEDSQQLERITTKLAHIFEQEFLAYQQNQV